MRNWIATLSAHVPMRNVIVDTNILIRALIKPTGSDGAIVQLVLQEQLRLYYSAYLLEELLHTLTYPRLQKKYHITQESIDIFIQTLMTWGSMVAVTKRITICRDPDDNELLSLAHSLHQAQPITIITADNDLLILADRFEHIHILTSQEFLKKTTV